MRRGRLCSLVAFITPGLIAVPLRREWVPSTSTIVAVGLLALCLVPARGQDVPVTPPPDESPVSSVSASSAPGLDANHALVVHGLVERWLREIAAAGKGGSPVPRGKVELSAFEPVPVKGATAVRVTLRQDGQALGTGYAFADTAGPAAAEKVVDLSTLTRSATASAVAGVRESLERAGAQAAEIQARAHERGDPKQALAGEGVKPVAVKALSDVAGDLLAEVEVGYGEEPIRLRVGSEPGEVYTHFVPDVHGLRLAWEGGRDEAGAAGAGQPATVWPGLMVALNKRAEESMVMLLGQARVPMREWDHVAQAGGPKLDRFRTHHVARASTALPAVVLVRGQELVPLGAADVPTIRSLSDRVAEHLRGRLVEGVGFRGTYLPSVGRYEPAVASPIESLLAGYALTRRDAARAQGTPLSPAEAKSAATVLDMATVFARREIESFKAANAFDPATASLALLTLLETPAPGADAKVRDQLGAMLVSLHRPRKGLADPQATSSATPAADRLAATPAGSPPAPDDPPLLNAPTTTLAAAALATLHAQTRDPEAGRVARDLSDTLAAGMIDGEGGGGRAAGRRVDVPALPWLALAHARLGPLLPEGDADAAIRHAERGRVLDVLADGLVERQVLRPEHDGPPDVVGGFQLVDLPPDTPPSPGWESAMVVDLLARTLQPPPQGEAAVKGEEGRRQGRLLAAGLGVRFLAQLTMQPTGAYYVRSPAEAVGGVRAALHDNSLSLTPSALTLLALLDLYDAARQLEAE